MTIHWLTATMAAVLLVGCGGGSSGRYGEDDEYTADTGAGDQSAGEQARQTVYEEHGAGSDGTGADASSVDANDVQDSGNYTCTQDCSGHEAGFAWAQEHDIEDASDCGGNSQSFIEGCEAFAEERQEQADSQVQELAEQAAEDASYESEADR